MFTSYVASFRFFSHTHTPTQISFGFICLFMLLSFFFFILLSRAACTLCIDAVYCNFFLKHCDAALSLFSTLSFHHFHCTFTRCALLWPIFYIYFWLFSCFLTLFTLQNFTSIHRLTWLCCARCALYQRIRVLCGCSSVHSGLFGERLSVQFFPSNFIIDTVMPSYSFAFETQVSIGPCCNLSQAYIYIGSWALVQCEIEKDLLCDRSSYGQFIRLGSHQSLFPFLDPFRCNKICTEPYHIIYYDLECVRYFTYFRRWFSGLLMGRGRRRHNQKCT